MLIVIYIFLALVVACLGWNSRLGFFGHFILALLLTPIVMLIFQILSRIFSDRHRRRLVEDVIHTRAAAAAAEAAWKTDQRARYTESQH